MATANYSVSLSAVLSSVSGDVSVGDVLCLDATGLSYIVATTANKGTRGSTGVALRAASAGQAIPIRSEGEIDPATSGLVALAGVEQYARVSSTGRLERVVSPSVSDEIVGKVNNFGGVRLSFSTVSTASTAVTYTLAATSVALAVGDWFCLAAGAASGTVTKATSAAVAAAGGVLGISSAVWNPGDTITGTVAGGTVPASVSGLGAGAAGDLFVNSTARSVRIAAPSGGETGGGTVDANGKITVAPFLSNVTAELRSYSPKSYGCPWDGVNDDLPGFQAMLAAISTVGANIHGARVDLPSGLGWFSDDLHLTRPVSIYGRGGGTVHVVSGFKFAPGKGLFLDGIQVSPDGGRFDTGSLNDLEVYSKNLIPFASTSYLQAIRAQNLVVKKGDVTLAASGHTTRFFRATTGGTTSASASDPTWSDTIGATVTDGTVVWTTEARLFNYATLTPYIVGQRVTVVGDTRYYFECEIAGTSSASMPAAMAQPQLTQLISDGASLKWRVKTHSGALVTVQCRINNCYFQGFTGFAVHIQAGAGEIVPTIADFVKVDGRGANFCGGGVYLGGSDVNGCAVKNWSTLFMGYQRTVKDANVGAGGNTIWNHGNGNRFADCYAQDGAGPAFYEDNSFPGVWDRCSSENSYGDILSANALVCGLGFTAPNASSLAMTLDRNYGQGVTETDRQGAKTIIAGLTKRDGKSAHWFSCSTDDASGAQTWSWAYQFGSFNTGIAGTGWWGLVYGPQNSSLAMGISSTLAAEGPGHSRLYFGQFHGREVAGARYKGVDVAALTSKIVRGGHHLVGDKFASQSTGAAGTFDELVCSVAGYRGPKWTTSTGVTAGSAVFGIFADLVEPTAHTVPPASGGNVFKCTTGGTTDSTTEPNWALAPAIGNTVPEASGTVVWTNVGTVAEYTKAQLNHSVSVSAATTDNILKTIATYAIPATSTVFLRCLVKAHEATGTGSVDGAGFDLQAVYTNVAGTAVLRGSVITKTYVNLNGTAWTAVFTISSGNVLVQVTGDTGKNIAWVCKRVDEELST